jgi:hypothetical protein
MPCHAMRCADSCGYALRFGSSGCGGPGAVRLFAANELGAAGATALALVLGSMSQLTYLDLGGDLAHVAERMIWELHLRGGRSFVPSRALRADNSLGAAGATALAPALPLMSVASLDLSSECASVPTAIGRLFRMANLASPGRCDGLAGRKHSLRLIAGNWIGAPGTAKLVSALPQHMTSLDLRCMLARLGGRVRLPGLSTCALFCRQQCWRCRCNIAGFCAFAYDAAHLARCWRCARHVCDLDEPFSAACGLE